MKNDEKTIVNLAKLGKKPVSQQEILQVQKRTNISIFHVSIQISFFCITYTYFVEILGNKRKTEQRSHRNIRCRSRIIFRQPNDKKGRKEW